MEISGHSDKGFIINVLRHFIEFDVAPGGRGYQRYLAGSLVRAYSRQVNTFKC